MFYKEQTWGVVLSFDRLCRCGFTMIFVPTHMLSCRVCFVLYLSSDIGVFVHTLKYFETKSAIDLAFYAAGKKDKFRGTGVFNSIQFERSPEEIAARNEAASVDNNKSSETTQQP